MKSKALGWVVLAGLTPIFFGKASRSETIEHGVQPAPGNSIPQGSQSICHGIPAGITLIPGLRTGWAIAQPQGNIELLFSDQPLACQELGLEGIGPIAQQSCVSAWSFSILLPPEMQMPGVYTLADHQVGFQNSFATVVPAQGCGGTCSGGVSGGGGAPGGLGPPGTVEIYSVTDQCITGRFQGLTTGQIQPPPPDLNGAFDAVRCTTSPPAAGDP